MRVAVEDKNNNIGFYRIDGRFVNKLIEIAKKDTKGLKRVWKYDSLEGNVFKNPVVIYQEKLTNN